MDQLWEKLKAVLMAAQSAVCWVVRWAVWMVGKKVDWKVRKSASKSAKCLAEMLEN